jgi:hypothetical protein
MAKRVMSDSEIRRRKKIQGEIGRTTSTMGLAGVGLLGASVAMKKPRMALAAHKLPGMHGIDPKKLGDAARNVGVVSAGIGGVGGFNQAKIYSNEARKTGPRMPVNPQKPKKKVVKSLDQISKIGDWKTIDQREQTQRRDRKAMRRSGAGAAFGGGLVALGYHDSGDKAKYKAAGGMAQTIRRAPAGARQKAKVAGKTAGVLYRDLSHSGKIGTGLIAGAAAVGGGAKTQHTYQQHKINQRRRANFRKSAFGIDHEINE